MLHIPGEGWRMARIARERREGKGGAWGKGKWKLEMQNQANPRYPLAYTLSHNKLIPPSQHTLIHGNIVQ
jgi:hypothetical protein